MEFFFDIDYQKTETAFSKLLDKEFSFKEAPGLNRVLRQYETGKINTETFIWNIQKLCAPTVQGRDVMKAWNSMLLSFRQKRIDFLIKLRKTYRVYLLSNINEMHADFVDRYVRKNYNLPDWQEQCFDKIYYSHIIKMRKPTKAIYKFILKDSNILTAESLFIDLVENVEAASSIGLHARQHNPHDEIIDKLDSYLKTVK